MTSWTVWALLTWLGPAAEPAEAPASEAPSVVSSEEVEAIQAELRRALEGLRLEGAPAPYRLEARLVRADLLSLDGSYGGIITNVLERQAAGAAEVRVGTPERDNSNFFAGDSGISRVDVPVESSPQLLRKKLWLALDRAFRGATQAYAAKSVALQRLNIEEVADSTSPPADPVVQSIEEAPPEPLPRDAMARLVEQLSARFAEHPTVDNGDVHLQVLRSTETVVTSEGLVLHRTHDRAMLAVVADTKAEDGMHLDHGLVLHFQGVPAVDEELRGAGEALVGRVLRELEQLAAAPMMEEEYDGPILFVDAAAPQFLASTVATEAAGTPAPLGEGGRMTELEPAWQKRLGKTVMPPFVDLHDDPSEGFGRLDIDAEGFRPHRLALVQDGRLQGLLMTRTPNPRKSGSNGRARMTPALEVGPAITNLVLDSRKRGLSRPALERELLARAREDGYEFAYVIESLRDGSILGPVPRESAAAYAGTGKLDLPLPARVWRLEPGGKRTLVRGAVLAPASIRVLRRIRALGHTPHEVPMRIAVGPFGGFGADVGIESALTQTVDVQVTSPDLLIEGLELLVERGEHERAPTLVHPLRRERKIPLADAQ